MNICKELNMLWVTKWMHGLYKVNIPWYEKLKDNYSLSLKSISKNISLFLIVLTMTHMMEFVSSAASISVT
jgi:hypothetical protein